MSAPGHEEPVELYARVASEYLDRFADMGVTELIVRGVVPSHSDTLGQRVYVAVKAGDTGAMVQITDFWPEVVLRQTLDVIARDRHALLQVRALKVEK